MKGLDNGLESLLEVATKTRAGQESGRIEREYLGALEDVGHVAVEETGRQTFGHGGLADAGFADEHRVVLSPAAQDLNRALQLVGTADQRIQLASLGAFREVHTICRQRIPCRGRALLGCAGRGLTLL